MTEQEIRDLFKSKSVPLERDDVWSVQAARVVRHKALERLAAALNITYAAPQILRAEKDEAVILVTGMLGDRSEWSIGEAAVNVNYRVSGKQVAYVYAMAEKRAKDRVILKLAGLHGAYSENEADDFKQPQQSSPVEVKRDDFGLPPVDDTSNRTLANALVSTLAQAQTPRELSAWFAKNSSTIESLPEALKDEVRSAYAGRLHELKRAA